MNIKQLRISLCILLVLFNSLFILSLFPLSSDNSQTLNEGFPLTSDDENFQDVIVFYNTSSYDEIIKSRFVYYGGTLKAGTEWNNDFSRLSGFAGRFPFMNISIFKDEFLDVNIERDELIESQLNYAALQAQAINSSWDLNGYKGDTNSSIAVLDTGVNINQAYLLGKILTTQNYVNGEGIEDLNGHGTLISSIIAGTGIVSYDANNPLTMAFNKTLSHLDLFDDYVAAKEYSFKVCSFNVSNSNANIIIESSWNLETGGIDKFWFDLYYNASKVNSTLNSNQNQIYSIIHAIDSSKIGIYDVFIRYHKLLNQVPKFSYFANISMIPESYVQNYNQLTGIANATKLLSLKVLNHTGSGYASDLITALSYVIQNKDTFHIVSACLSMATLGENLDAVNQAIDEVIENGIVVVIAAGNYGIKGSSPLNKLAMNENAIVVGAINDKDQITAYSSLGMNLEDGVIKPDIVAPGGSTLSNHRSILAADKGNKTITASSGTSISAAIVSAAINLLIEAKWGSWSAWNAKNTSALVKELKSILLMTASETNVNREDDPLTEVNETDNSPTTYTGFANSLKDVNEGFGRVNLLPAVDALTKYVSVGEIHSGKLTSSGIDPLQSHVYARRIKFESNHQYKINVSEISEDAVVQMFLFSNQTDNHGEPILLKASQRFYGNLDTIYFTPKLNQTECVFVLKILEGSSSFSFQTSEVTNLNPPSLMLPEIRYVGGWKNTTVMGLQQFLGYNPAKNYSIDSYRFYINYYDPDSSNVPPQYVYVSISEQGKNYTLTQSNEIDANFSEGVLFWSDYIELSTPLTYHYWFVASDGLNRVRFPEYGNLNISIEFPTDSAPIPYYHSFEDGFLNWSVDGTGWSILNQSNQNDNRDLIYEDDWHSAYFGTNHDYPSSYSYQPYKVGDPYPNGSLYSPLFNLIDFNPNGTNIIARFGLRTSIHSGDYVYLQLNLNWSGWVTLKTYTNQEREWFMDYFNLTEYIGYFIQFRFLTNLDTNFDNINYKGFMVDFLAIENHTNTHHPSIIFNAYENLTPLEGSAFETYTFSCNYYDPDNDYPTFIYLEIDGTNYTMINAQGLWNTSSFSANGVLFTKELVLKDFDDLKFRFHTYDGKFSNNTEWVNEDGSLIFFTNPVAKTFNYYQSNKYIGYQFYSSNLSQFFVGGVPYPKDNTAWLLGDNTWHPIIRLGREFVYAGLGLSYGGIQQGYGINWQAELISRPIFLGGEYKTYLTFYQEISLQNEFFLEEEDLDRCILSISTDFGKSWITLKEYVFDSEDLSGNQTIDISGYRNQYIMIKFTLKSNDNQQGLGYGWLLSNIYVGYDKSNDFIYPVVEILFPSNNDIVSSSITIKANISDNIGLNIDRIYLYINSKLISQDQLHFNESSGTLTHMWDTTFYTDGFCDIKIVIYDLQGNRAEQNITVRIENGFLNWKTWGPWLIMILSTIFIGAFLFFIAEKKGKYWVKKIRNGNAENVRLKDIDKDQVIKRIELIEKREELDRPLTLHCKFCDSWFTSSKYHYICPRCSHDQIYVAYNCMNCGKWHFKDEPRQDYYCKNCGSVRLVRREIVEVKNILAKQGLFLRNYEFKDKKYSILD